MHLSVQKHVLPCGAVKCCSGLVGNVESHSDKPTPCTSTPVQDGGVVRGAYGPPERQWGTSEGGLWRNPRWGAAAPPSGSGGRPCEGAKECRGWNEIKHSWEWSIVGWVEECTGVRV